MQIGGVSLKPVGSVEKNEVIDLVGKESKHRRETAAVACGQGTTAVSTSEDLKLLRRGGLDQFSGRTWGGGGGC